MSISFAISAYNEHEELKRLLDQLVQVVKPSDEIVIQLDTKSTQEVIELVDNFLISITTIEYQLLVLSIA